MVQLVDLVQALGIPASELGRIALAVHMGEEEAGHSPDRILVFLLLFGLFVSISFMIVFIIWLVDNRVFAAVQPQTIKRCKDLGYQSFLAFPR